MNLLKTFRNWGRPEKKALHRMRVVVSRELVRHPIHVAPTADGGILIETCSEEGTFWEAYGPELRTASQARFDRPDLALISAPDGKHWVLDRAGVSPVETRGDRFTRVEVSTPEGMRLSASAALHDGLLFTCQHDVHRAMSAPIFKRVNKDGTERWSATLPIELLAYDGVVQASRKEGWKIRTMDPWTPKSWVSTSRTVAASGDAVLACFHEVESEIGFGYVRSLNDGALRFITQKGPIREVAALGEGAFLVGYQGYGAFETLRYERDGSVRTRWPSHGYYVVRGDDVRVIEMENQLPSKLHLVRFRDDGAVLKGGWLDGHYTSRPYIHTDGTLIFFRNGSLHAARDLSLDGKLDLGPPGNRHSTNIAGNNEGLYFAIGQMPPKDQRARLVRAAF